MKHLKLVYSKNQPRSSSSEPSISDFAIYASYHVCGRGLFAGTLRVVRKPDGRLLYPYDGAPLIGPFETKQAACEAAARLGSDIVTGDIRCPAL